MLTKELQFVILLLVSGLDSKHDDDMQILGCRYGEHIFGKCSLMGMSHMAASLTHSYWMYYRNIERKMSPQVGLYFLNLISLFARHNMPYTNR